MAPALDLGLIPILRVTLEIVLGERPGGRSLLGELLTDEGILGLGSVASTWPGLIQGVQGRIDVIQQPPNLIALFGVDVFAETALSVAASAKATWPVSSFE
jgi:hypothetical protein